MLNELLTKITFLSELSESNIYKIVEDFRVLYLAQIYFVV